MVILLHLLWLLKWYMKELIEAPDREDRAPDREDRAPDREERAWRERESGSADSVTMD